MSAMMIRSLKCARDQAQLPDHFSDRDNRLLMALADEQLRFGQAEEALVLLQICQIFRPADAAIIRRLARVFAALEEFEAAGSMLDALDRLPAPEAPLVGEALLRATIWHGLNRAAEAVRAFGDYLTLSTRSDMR